MPRHAALRRLAAAWRALPAQGRLALTAEFKPKPKPKLLIAEVRAIPARLVLPGWAEPELALRLVLQTVSISPPAYAERTLPLAIVGLHALARRFQRGPPAARADAALLRDLAPLARGWPAAVSQDADEIAIPTAAGSWLGAVMAEGTSPVLAVRTFVDTGKRCRR